MLARWVEKLGKFNFENHHQAGKNILHADCLSRVPAVEDTSLVEEKIQILIEQPTDNSWSDVLETRLMIFDSINRFLENEVFCLMEQKKRPEKRQMVGASKTTWKLWTDFQRAAKATKAARRKLSTPANSCTQFIHGCHSTSFT